MSFTIEVGPDHELNIAITSGLNHKLRPFNTIHVNGHAAGQMTPAEVRQMALQWLEAAEAAESDALIVAELMETAGLDLQTAGAFIVALRERREKAS